MSAFQSNAFQNNAFQARVLFIPTGVGTRDMQGSGTIRKISSAIVFNEEAKRKKPTFYSFIKSGAIKSGRRRDFRNG